MASDSDLKCFGSFQMFRIISNVSDPNIFMWIQMKQNYNKHVERLENWKVVNEEEKRVDKARLVTLFFMKWEAPLLDIMLEFLNTFVIKGTNIYFGYQNKVYVISKQLIVVVFKVCAQGYVKDPKRKINKTITLQALQSCRIAPINFLGDKWSAKSLALPYIVKYPVIRSVIY